MRSRKSSPSKTLGGEDGGSSDDDGSVAGNKVLRLALVHPGSFVPWQPLSNTDSKRVWEVAEPSTGETEAGSDEDSDEGEKYDDDMLNLMRAQVNAEKKMKKLLALKIKQEEEEWRTSVYTLTSVGGKGEAELIRLLFVIANQPFKDERITKEEWEEMKPTTPYQTLPILSRCGRQWGEAGAIVRMLARKFLLLGVINDEHLIVEATYERLRRLKHQNNRAISWVISGEKNREKLEWAQGQLLHVILPPALKEWDQLLQKTRGPFIAASGMTMADIAIVDFLDQCSSHLMIDSLLSDFMAVSDLLTVIKACPSLRKYGDERPED